MTMSMKATSSVRPYQRNDQGSGTIELTVIEPMDAGGDDAGRAAGVCSPEPRLVCSGDDQM